MGNWAWAQKWAYFVPLYVTATVTSDAQSFRRPVAVWFFIAVDW